MPGDVQSQEAVTEATDYTFRIWQGKIVWLSCGPDTNISKQSGYVILGEMEPKGKVQGSSLTRQSGGLQGTRRQSIVTHQRRWLEVRNSQKPGVFRKPTELP